MNPPPMAEVVELTVEEGRAMLDDIAKTELGISYNEFIANLEAGKYDGSENFAVNNLIILRPFAG